MNKLNRNIDEIKMNRSKEKSLDYVMNEINKEPKKLFSFSFSKYRAIPAFVIMIALVLTIVLTNGTDPNPDPISNPDNPLLDTVNSEKLVELSYITGSLVVSSFTIDTVPSLMMLADLDETEFESDILEFNAYFEMLRVFMDDDPFGNNLTVEELTEGEYSTKMTFNVDGTSYIFLINLDETILTGTLEVNGLLLDVTGKLEDSNDELKFEIKASNGLDYIEIKYKVESDDEIEKTYEITSYINGVNKDKEIKISIEDNETKVKLKEGNTEYELEKEIEDGLIKYKLQYHIGEIEGEAVIFEGVDALGNTIYTYQINEDGHEREIDIDKEEHDSHEDDEDEEEDEEEDLEDQSNTIIPISVESFL